MDWIDMRRRHGLVTNSNRDVVSERPQPMKSTTKKWSGNIKWVVSISLSGWLEKWLWGIRNNIPNGMADIRWVFLDLIWPKKHDRNFSSIFLLTIFLFRFELGTSPHSKRDVVQSRLCGQSLYHYGKGVACKEVHPPARWRAICT